MSDYGDDLSLAQHMGAEERNGPEHGMVLGSQTSPAPPPVEEAQDAVQDDGSLLDQGSSHEIEGMTNLELFLPPKPTGLDLQEIRGIITSTVTYI